MRWLVLLIVPLVSVLGCAPHEAAPPLPPAPPEDLSTWTVPELVQPPASPPHASALVDEKPTAAEKVYTFAPGTPYTVLVPVGWPLDIVLERGEQVHNIVGGDRAPETTAPPSGDPTARLQTAMAQAAPPPPPPSVPDATLGARRWEVREGKSGAGDTVQAHIFVAASEPGLTTGLIITTTKRTYLLTCQSVKKSAIRVLRWTYGLQPVEATHASEPPGLLPDPQAPRRYHVGYILGHQGRVPDWSPRYIVDDGKKLYIVYPEVTLFGSVPVVRMGGPNGPQLVNARQYLNVVIVDQLPAQAELRVGIGTQAEVVTITRGALRTIACPGDDACPVWPAAAPSLARRPQP